MVKANNYLRVCKKCKATCCKMGGPDFSEREMKMVLKKGYKNYFIKIGKNHYELKSKKLMCPYLKEDNSCEIHIVKPLMCLCWPVCVDLINNKKKLYLAECPITKILIKKDIEKCKKEALKIPKNVLEGCFSNSRLSKSDLMLIKKRLARFKKKPI